MATVYECRFCGKVVNTSSGLATHIGRLHKGIPRPRKNVKVSPASEKDFYEGKDPEELCNLIIGVAKELRKAIVHRDREIRKKVADAIVGALSNG